MVRINGMLRLHRCDRIRRLGYARAVVVGVFPATLWGVKARLNRQYWMVTTLN